MQHRGLAVALFAASVALLVGAPRPVAAATVVVKFMEFNFCGVLKDDACGGDYSVEDAPPDAYYDPTFANYILDFHPDVVAINEICADQLVLLNNDLAAGGWTFVGQYFKAQEIVDRCKGTDESFGNAILTRKSQTNKQFEWLKEGAEGRMALCVTTTVGTNIPLAACVAKMSTDYELAKAEIIEAMNWAFGYSNIGDNKALFIGGDFNVEPNLAPFGQFYLTSGGQFQEMDQCSADHGGRFGGPPANPGCNRYTHVERDDPTHENKIDYMFFKQAWAKNYLPEEPEDVPSSDHHITWGKATICSQSTCGG